MYLVFFIVAILIWGTDAALTKRFLIETLSPASALALRYIFATLCLTPFALPAIKKLRLLNRRDWLNLIALVLGGSLLSNLIYYYSLTLISAFVTTMLVRLEPVFIILLSAIFLKRTTSRRTWFFTIIAVGCSWLIAAGSGGGGMSPQTLLGVGLMIISTLLWAIATLQGKTLLEKLSPIMLTWLRIGMTTLFLLPFQGRDLFARLPEISTQSLFVFFIMGALHSGLAFWFYYKGLKASTPLIASLAELLEPISGLAASLILLGETPQMIQIIGIAGLLVTLYLLTVSIKPED